MAIDKKLLRAAWPKGYLAMRGVYTIEGWLFSSDCLIFSEYGFYKRAVRERTSFVVHRAGTNNHVVQGWIDEGDLLPNVDPSDTATWACLLRDLAEACPGDENPLGPPKPLHGLTWVQTMKKRWELGDGSRVTSRYFSLDTDDPAEALVLARIQLRENS